MNAGMGNGQTVEREVKSRTWLPEDAVQIKPGGRNSTFNEFLTNNEAFFIQKFSNLIGKPLYYGAPPPRDGVRSSLGLITRIELGEYSAIYTNDSRVRVMLCSSGGVVGPCDGEGILYYLLPHEVSTPCELIGSKPAEYVTAPPDFTLPPVLWRIVQEYDGPELWSFTLTSDFAPLDAWFGPFFKTFNCHEHNLPDTWLK